MSLFEHDGVSFGSGMEEEGLDFLKNDNLLKVGREDELNDRGSSPMKVEKVEKVENHEKVQVQGSPNEGMKERMVRYNPHMMTMRVGMNGMMFVNPREICLDPFYTPKRNTGYVNVFRHLQEDMMNPEGPVEMNESENEGQGKGSQGEGEEPSLMDSNPLESEEMIKESELEDGETDDNFSKRKYEEEEEELNDFKLPASKSPIMEAMSFCAIKKLGIEVGECKDKTDTSEAQVVFKVTDFEKYYRISSSICSKQNPTEDIGSRVKSLRRWFTNFPKKKDRKDNSPFSLEVKPEVSKKVHDMLEKYRCMVNVKKRRRMK